jgi:hypothetical protein
MKGTSNAQKLQGVRAVNVDFDIVKVLHRVNAVEVFVIEELLSQCTQVKTHENQNEKPKEELQDFVFWFLGDIGLIEKKGGVIVVSGV